MKKRILVAPLNWGIGHATRCIPIINALIANNFEPILASDGDALHILKAEFPNLKVIELPSYNIEYSKKGAILKWKILAQTPKIIKAKKAEKKATKTIIDNYNISGIISDNRFGVQSNKIPSVFITHQLNVLSGNTSKISTKLHQSIMSKFDEIWVPDFENEPNLSGKLGHIKTEHYLNLKYIGALSRLNKISTKIEYDIMVLLSGPEPQRSLLADKLFAALEAFSGKVLFVKGNVEDKQTIEHKDQFTIYNFMTSEALEDAINKSKIIISRSGYTTIMDLAKLNKSAFFIPTPGQFEQEYLAKHFDDKNIVPSCNQDDFKFEMLERIKDCGGLKMEDSAINYKKLFSIF